MFTRVAILLKCVFTRFECSLPFQVQFSSLHDLEVKQNNDRSFDFTSEGFTLEASVPQAPQLVPQMVVLSFTRFECSFQLHSFRV
jgi:hypothetical protein